MIHLGIHYGHNATIAVVKNGELIFCQSEERLNRIKNSVGFPVKTLDYIYKNICSPEDVESATLFQESVYGYLHLKSHNFVPYQYGSYLNPEDRYFGLLRNSELRWKLGQLKGSLITQKNKSLKAEIGRYFSKAIMLPKEKIHYINHHLAHAFSAVPNIQEWGRGLVFTLDGVGDSLCATVNKYENGEITVLNKVNHRNSIGYYYSAITALMGMKSGEHEFKVMGLAPYSRRSYYFPILEKLRELLRIDDDGNWVSEICPTKLQDTLGSIIQYQRFDNIAGAIQELTEELICKWVDYWIKKTGIQDIAVSGGVFMNVKACQDLLKGKMVGKLFVVPSAADESTAIGAAFWAASKFENNIKLQSIGDLYLGVGFTDEEINHVFQSSDISDRYEIIQTDNINYEVASLLAKDQIVARFSGRMEFGARALGNRSILANPSSLGNLELINSSIKNRDFWMPFTPSILEEDMGRYIVNSERIFSPYMCITFDTTEEARADIPAAIHPRDKTARPQCVTKEWNPDYYELISIFKNKTGIGAVLNTSFNLHGEPNVCSPENAIHTMDNSGLRYLAIGSYLLKKR